MSRIYKSFICIGISFLMESTGVLADAKLSINNREFPSAAAGTPLPDVKGCNLVLTYSKEENTEENHLIYPFPDASKSKNDSIPEGSYTKIKAACQSVPFEDNTNRNVEIECLPSSPKKLTRTLGISIKQNPRIKVNAQGKYYPTSEQPFLCTAKVE